MNYSLIDLDELTLRCRDRQAREYIQEAVASYKAGAYRACIVSTWIAVVLDFLHKLRELEMTGDARAKAKLEEFEKIRAGGENSLKAALDFEREVLTVAANEFELLTPLEKDDLERLQKDRSRCAHPSMQSIDEPYQPTPELARSHLRNAVEILLQREPVQGAAAFGRICAEIKSEYFPITTADAKIHFENGPLVRAREVLIRRLIVGLSKALLNEELSAPERRRLLAAIAAILEMHRRVAESIIHAEIARIMGGVEDKFLWLIILYIRKIPIAWDASGAPIQGKLRNFLEQEEGNMLLVALHHAMQVPALKQIALDRVNGLSSDQLGKILSATEPVPEYIPFAINFFNGSGSYRSAEWNGESLIIPIASMLSPEHFKEIIDASMENRQIYEAGGMENIFCKIFDLMDEKQFDKNMGDWQRFLTFLKEINIDCFSGLQAKMESKGMWPVQ
jgi:hypothetical protein